MASGLENIETIESPFRRFVTTIGVFPTAFTDAMTYYECLAYLVKYLEDSVVPAVNENAEALKELQNYVVHYFDNLDVQDEINNKLDEMAEAGTLQEIITQYIQANTAWCFDTVANMKTAENFINGSYAQTLGYYAKNDGGNALYKIRTITNDDVVDDKFIIELADDTLIAELITDKKVNVCKVGGQQNLGSVCNYLITKGYDVYIPAGEFNVETTIVINQPDTQFICDGDLTFTGSNSTMVSVTSRRNVIEFNGNVYAGDSNVFMELGAGAGYVANTTVFVESVRSSKIGLLLNPNGNSHCVQFLQFTFNLIHASEKGIYLACGNDGEPWVNANTFNGGLIQAPYGIVARKGANQVDRYGDNCFNRIAFESIDRDHKITCCLDLQFVQKSWFDKVRIVEDLDDTNQIVLDSCQDIYIENVGRVYLNKISITNEQTWSNHTFKGSIIIDQHGNYATNEIRYTKGAWLVADNNCWNIGVGQLMSYSATSTDWTAIPDFYYDDISVVIGDNNTQNSNLTYHLPEIFTNNIQSFYLYVQSKRANSALTLQTSGTETIIAFPTGSEMANKLYHVEHGVQRGSHLPKWRVIEMNYIDPAA